MIQAVGELLTLGAEETLDYILLEAYKICHDSLRCLPAPADCEVMDCIPAHCRFLVAMKPGGEIQSVSRQFAMMLQPGAQPEDMIGRNVFALVPSETVEYRMRYHAACVQFRQPIRLTDYGQHGHVYESVLVPVVQDDAVTSVVMLAAVTHPREFVMKEQARADKVTVIQ